MYTVLPRILCVDDEPHLLEAMVRSLRRHFDVTVASGGEEGLDRVDREGPFAVVVSDQRMPAMDGVTFLTRVRETAPDTVRILLTGYADTAAAMGAVNRGAVFRFLSKPIDTPEFHHTLNDAVAQHKLLTSERLLLRRTLHGSVTAIIDVLALVNPGGFGRAVRARGTVSALTAAAGGQDAWQIEVAAMFAQVGSFAQAHGSARPELISSLGQVEASTVGRLSKIAAEMVANIPRMEGVHAILTHQDLRFDGSNGAPGAPRERAIPTGARMLKIAFDLDALEEEGMTRAAALEAMRGRWGWYDADMLDALMRSGPAAATPNLPATRSPAGPGSQEIEVRLLEPGMTLLEPIVTGAGRVLIARDEVVAAESLRRVKSTLGFNELRQTVRVRAAVSRASPGPPATVPVEKRRADAAKPGRLDRVEAGGMTLDLTMKLTV